MYGKDVERQGTMTTLNSLVNLQRNLADSNLPIASIYVKFTYRSAAR